MRRWLIVMAGLLLFGAMGACSSSKNTTIAGEIALTTSPIHSQPGQSIEGYTTADGMYHQFHGVVRLQTDSTLSFSSGSHVPEYSLQKPEQMVTIVLPRDSVVTIFTNHTDVTRTAFAVIGVTVLTLGVIAVIKAATKESCPFIYSWDGKQFVFDGEPYGGATMHSLERTDWSELEHLQVAHGQYRLLLTNEVDETQHTNSLELLVVDHAPGTTVVIDREGRAHAFREPVRLAAAHDENGRDLLTWLREKDHASWYPRLEDYATTDSLRDTRSHITLEFVRPAGVQKAFLLSTAATGQWGSHMIRTMLGMRGDRVQDFYAAINGSDLYRQQLYEWNRREELFELHVEVRADSGWERQDFIPGSGPFIAETRAIPLDLSRVSGERVQIRIHPPIGFWNLDCFQLAWRDETPNVTTVPLRAGVGERAQAVLEALRSADDRYLDFPTTHDREELVFDAPPSVKGLERSVFARTRGWYEVHLHGTGPPDVAGLERLANEPGYIVRRSLEEFRSYERTGVLMGVPQATGGSGAR
jgi:hypothetical protein